MGTTGSYALSNDLSDFFLSGLDYIAKIIERAVNDIFKELTILNFGEQDKYPTFKLSGISDKAGKELESAMSGNTAEVTEELIDYFENELKFVAKGLAPLVLKNRSEVEEK